MVRDALADDLDGELVRGFLDRERGNAPRVFGGLSDEDALLSSRVLKRDETGVPRPTLAGLLALGRHPQEFYPRLNVTFAVFPGISKGEAAADGVRFLDSKTVVGPIPALISETLAAVRRNMRVVSRMDGASRIDEPEYPDAAVPGPKREKGPCPAR